MPRATPPDLAAASLRFGAALLLAGYVLVLGLPLIFNGHSWFIETDGRPMPTDFSAYHVAGRFALNNEAAAAYDWDRFSAAIKAFVGQDREHWLGWLNPPIFVLVVAPFAALPFEGSALTWLGATGLAYAAAARAALPCHGAALLALAAPAALACVVKGQNGLLSAALIGYGLILLGRRPVLAGICIGALSYKPHLGLVLPVLLLVAGQWRAFASAAATVVGLAALSVLAFGPETWVAFLDSLGGTAGRFLLQGMGRPAMQSIYAFAAPHLGNGAAMSVHATVAVVATAFCATLWRRRPGHEGPAAAAAIAATFLATPYAFNHDAAMLAIAALLCMRDDSGAPASILDGAPLCLAVLLPGVTLVTLNNLAGPAAALIILTVAWRRTARARERSALHVASPP